MNLSREDAEDDTDGCALPIGQGGSGGRRTATLLDLVHLSVFSFFSSSRLSLFPKLSSLLLLPTRLVLHPPSLPFLVILIHGHPPKPPVS